MSNILEYKGYKGSVVFSAPDNCLWGKILGITSNISYEADSVDNIKFAFEEAVDDYLDFCSDRSLEPNVPVYEQLHINNLPFEVYTGLMQISHQTHKTIDETALDALKTYTGLFHENIVV